MTKICTTLIYLRKFQAEFFSDTFKFKKKIKFWLGSNENLVNSNEALNALEQ